MKKSNLFNATVGGENKILCLGTTYANMEALQGFTGGGGGVVEMRLMPNPAENSAQVHYVVEDLPDYNGGVIKLYSISGRLIESKKVTETKGQTRFNMTNLSSGTYVIVFFTHGQRIGQQILIKQ